MSNWDDEMSAARLEGTISQPRDLGARDGKVAVDLASLPSAVAAYVNDLREENARLREAIAARDTFLAVAAHELRNPMTPIVGRVERLRRMMRKPDVALETIESGFEQIEWLIGRYLKRATTLLDVSRVTSGKFRLDLAQAELSPIVQEVAESFRPIVEHAGSLLTITVPAGPVVRVCDRLALEQILDNLISNAIKYAAGRPIEVSLVEDVVEGHVVLRVRDHGPGISPESQSRIFERFERAVRPGEHSGGFGVGLWIVRQMAEAMGGSVSISSQPNEGAMFIVTLPLANPEVP